MKQKIIAAIGIFSALLILCGCGSSSSDRTVSESRVSLWVVTEKTTADGMNYQLEYLSEQFQAEHSNVSIQVDILPYDEPERSSYLKEIQEKMNAGNGPDLFILPTSTRLEVDHPASFPYRNVTALFPDIEIAMRNGYFADISKFYNADRDLEKDKLNTDVMGAGVVGSSRFLLPLRYTMPVLYVFNAECEEMGVNFDFANSNIETWMQYVMEQADPVLACGAEYASVNVFSDLIDYNKETVLLTKDSAEAYIRTFRQIEALIGEESSHRGSPHIHSYFSSSQKRFPVKIDSLNNALTYASYAAYRNLRLSMYPVRTTSGDTIATVSYYGAVSSSCASPETAYAFLRTFLTKESQWEQNLPEYTGYDYTGLVKDSWPVYTEGSVEPVWNTLLTRSLDNRYTTIQLTEDSIPLLDIEIDIVRFPFTNTFQELLYGTEESTVADVSQAAAEFIIQINDHIAMREVAARKG